ncbi:MAG: DUF559 domain-containing protein [Dehalococcoidia bacterium]
MIDTTDLLKGFAEAFGRTALSFWPVWAMLAGLLLLAVPLRRLDRATGEREKRRPRRTKRAPESSLERRFLELIGEAGLVRPEIQYIVPAGGHEYRIDFAYPKLKLAIELDGCHHQQRERREWDARRDEHLAELGWRTIRLQSHDVEATPQSVVSRLVEAGVRQRRGARPLET